MVRKTLRINQLNKEENVMQGPWIKVPKPDDSRGRPGPKITEIHDDKKAKTLGYPGGFVGGDHL